MSCLVGSTPARECDSRRRGQRRDGAGMRVLKDRPTHCFLTE